MKALKDRQVLTSGKWTLDIRLVAMALLLSII
jgi:hypothetical protein